MNIYKVIYELVNALCNPVIMRQKYNAYIHEDPNETHQFMFTFSDGMCVRWVGLSILEIAILLGFSHTNVSYKSGSKTSTEWQLCVLQTEMPCLLERSEENG